MNKSLKFLLSYIGWVATVFGSLFLATLVAGEPFQLTGKLIVACLVGGAVRYAVQRDISADIQ